MVLRLKVPPEKKSFGFQSRVVLANFIRIAVLFFIGLPYVMASVMTYRPKVELKSNPQPSQQRRMKAVG